MRHELYRFAAEANVLTGESWSAGEKCNRRAAASVAVFQRFGKHCGGLAS
jgi:hypothetical protein